MASETAPPPGAPVRRSGGAPHRFGWFRMSLRFLSRSLTVRASSFILALLAVTVGTGVAATVINLKMDLVAKMSRELRRYGPNLLVTPAADAATPTLDEAEVRALAVAPDMAAASISPLLIAAGTVAPGGGGWADRAAARRSRAAAPRSRAAAPVVGADFEALRHLNPTWRVEGDWPAVSDPSPCLVGVSLAQRADLAPGQEVVLTVAGTPAPLKVAGIVSTGEAEDDAIFVPLPWLQERTGHAGRVSLAALSVEGGPGAVERAAETIGGAIPGAAARPLRRVAAAQGAILGRLDRMMVLLTAVVLVLSGLCLTTTLMSIVIERQTEIGLMRSIGAGDRDILMMFLGEVSLLGALGGTLGLLLGWAGAHLIGRRLFDAAIVARADVAPIVMALALVLCWIAVLVPLRRALAIQPAAALRGE